MCYKYHFTIGLILMMGPLQEGRAQVTVDTFADNSKDTTLWGPQEGGTATLAETNGRLNYVNTNSFAEVEVSWPSKLVLPEDRAWQVTVEVHNAVQTGVNPQTASLGIAVFPYGNRVSEVFLELYSSWSAPGSVWGYNAQMVKAGLPFDYYGNDSGNTISTNAGELRLTFEPGSKVIRAEYQISGQPGWVELASFGVAGSGGSTANDVWSPSGPGGYELTLWGYSLGKTVAGGLMYFESVTIDGGSLGPFPPLVAADDQVTVHRDVREYMIEAKANDRSLAGSPGTISITQVSASGIGATVSTDGDTIRYTPPAGFTGSDLLEYSIEDGNGNTDSAQIVINIVDVSYPGSEADKGLISMMEVIASSLPQWQRYWLLYRKHIAEILYLTVEPQLTIQSNSEQTVAENGRRMVARTGAGTAQTQAMLISTFHELTRPAAAVITGQTDQVQVSVELVESITAMRDYLQQAGSPSLQADLLDLRADLGEPWTFIDRSVEEQSLVSAGESTAELKVAGVTLSPDSLVSVLIENITGLNPELWRRQLNGLAEWVSVSAYASGEGPNLILQDPDPAEGPLLYQVRSTLP